jgi:hypothetical protein
LISPEATFSSAFSAIDLPGEGPFRCRLAHGDEPLVGQHRLDDHAGTVAARHHQLVRLDLFQQALRFQVGHDLLARFEAVQARYFSGDLVDLGLQVRMLIMGRLWRWPTW